MSVSSEITRIQNAKTALKNSINAKTDNQHQITTETIDDYADFVDTIQTGGGSSSRLPTGYQEVEYLESTGTQYIDTGIIPQSTTRMVLDVQFSNITDSNRNGWGSNNSQESFFCGLVGTQSKFCISVSKNWGVWYGSDKNLSRHIFDISNTALSIDNVSYGTGDITDTATSGQTLYIFALHTEYSPYYQCAKEKIYSCKIYNNDVLVRDLVPCFVTQTAVIGMYDLVTNSFYTNIGTGNFTKGPNVTPINLQTKSVTITSNTTTNITADTGYDGLESVSVTTNVSGGGSSPRLPSEYQEVEYIQSSGTQYIDTNVLGDDVDSINMTFVFPNLPNAVNNICGTRDSNSTAISPIRINSSNTIEPYFGSGISTNTTLVANQKYNVTTEYSSGNQKVYIDGELKATSNKTYSGPSNYTNYLFGLNDHGNASYVGSFKLYSCQMKKNNVLIRDLVPCYNINDSFIGLYDLVNDVFYRNAGTGVFTKGSDVTPELNLQTKSVTITTNTTTNVTPDSGYDGLSSVSVVTNVSGGDTPYVYEYVQDGLLAWFDGEDDVDSNEHWNSRIGNDYISQYYVTLTAGANTTNKFYQYKRKQAYINPMIYCLNTQNDYYVQDYTIEVVGTVYSPANSNDRSNTNASGAAGVLFAFNKTASPILSVQFSDGIFIPLNHTDPKTNLETEISGLLGKRCTFALHLQQIVPKGTSSGSYILNYTVNGDRWYTKSSTSVNNMNTYYGTNCVMSYYTQNSGTNHYASCTEVCCIRIYNRKLTAEELAYNHNIDMHRFKTYDYQEEASL